MLMTKIGMIGRTGLTSMHRPVRPVKVNFPKFRFEFTIAYLSSRRSKCIYGTSNLNFG